MSAKKKPVILGPDGRPYVAPPKKAVAKPEPEPVKDLGPVSTELHSWTLKPYFDVSRYLTDAGRSPLFGGLTAHLSTASKKPALADAVARDVAALTADFEGASIEELPKAPADLTTYADAFDSARKNCPHENVVSTMYARREYFCEDCRTYIRRRPGLFG